MSTCPFFSVCLKLYLLIVTKKGYWGLTPSVTILQHIGQSLEFKFIEQYFLKVDSTNIKVSNILIFTVLSPLNTIPVIVQRIGVTYWTSHGFKDWLILYLTWLVKICSVLCCLVFDPGTISLIFCFLELQYGVLFKILEDKTYFVNEYM